MCLNALDPESFEDMILILSMFNGIGWAKKGNTAICLHNAREVARFAS